MPEYPPNYIAPVNMPKPCPCPSVEELKAEFKEQQTRIHKGDVTFERVVGQLDRMSLDLAEIKEALKELPTQKEYDELKSENALIRNDFKGLNVTFWSEMDRIKTEIEEHKQSHITSFTDKLKAGVGFITQILIVVIAALILYKMGVS